MLEVCGWVVNEVRRVGDSTLVVLGYYGEVGLRIYGDGVVRVEWCNGVLLDVLLEVVECLRGFIRCLDV